MVGLLTCRRIAPPLTGRSLVWISSSSFTEKEESAFSTAALARACSFPMAEGSFPVHGDKARLGERLGEAIPADGQRLAYAPRHVTWTSYDNRLLSL